MLAITLFALALASQVAAFPIASPSNTTHAAVKRSNSGRATFFAVGLGACGITNVKSDYIVALNSAQFQSSVSYPGPECFKEIWISYNGKTTNAQITDECPSCSYGDLDMSEGLFDFFASEDLGVFQMTWGYVDSSSSEQTSTSKKAEPTTSYTPTSTYVAPSTSQTPTSTYVPPSSTSSSEWVAPTTSTEARAQSTWAPAPTSTSTSADVATTTSAATSSDVVTTSAYALASNATSASTSTATASPSVTLPVSSVSEGAVSFSNFEELGKLMVQLGEIVVVSAQGVKQG